MMMNRTKFILITIILGGLFIHSLAYTQDLRDSERIRLARQYEKLGQFEEAAKIYRQLYLNNPQNPIFRDGLKRNYFQLKRFAELIDLIEEGLKKSPTNFQLKVDLGEAYLKSGRQKKALQLWEKLLDEHAKQATVYRVVAMTMLQNGLYREAIDVYKRGRKRIGDENLFVLELANLHTAMLNYEDAIEEYLKFLQKNPRQLSFVEDRLSQLAGDAEGFRIATQMLKGKIQKDRGNYSLRKLLADLYLRAAAYGEAFQQIVATEKMLGSRPAFKEKSSAGKGLFDFAEAAFRDEAYEYAAKAYKEVVANFPNFSMIAKAKFGLAQSYEKRALFEQAISSYWSIIYQYPNSQWALEAYLRIGDIKFEHYFDLKGAMGAYATVLTEYSNNPKRFEAVIRIGDCLVAQGDLKGAQVRFQQALREGSKQKSIWEKALFKLAQVHFWQGDFKQALEKFNRVAAERFEGLYVNDALNYIMLLEENRDQPKEVLETYAQALRLEKMRKYDQAISALKVLTNDFPKAPLAGQALFRIGELESKQGNFNRAIDTYRSLIESRPQSLLCDLAQKRIGEVYEKGLGDVRRAKEAYELVLLNYPQSLLGDEVRKKIRVLDRQKGK